MITFVPDRRFDRVASIEIFEHTRSRHYQRNPEAWLCNLGRACAGAVLPILGRRHHEQNAVLRLQGSRLFLMACSELFACRRGNEWYVAHDRLAAC